MTAEYEAKLFNTLKSIDGTLKRIEQQLSEENQHHVITESVVHALTGDRHHNTEKAR